MYIYVYRHEYMRSIIKCKTIMQQQTRFERTKCPAPFVGAISLEVRTTTKEDVHTYVYIYTYIYMYVYKCTCIHTYIQILTRTHSTNWPTRPDQLRESEHVGAGCLARHGSAHCLYLCIYIHLCIQICIQTRICVKT